MYNYFYFYKNFTKLIFYLFPLWSVTITETECSLSSNMVSNGMLCTTDFTLQLSVKLIISVRFDINWPSKTMESTQSISEIMLSTICNIVVQKFVFPELSVAVWLIIVSPIVTIETENWFTVIFFSQLSNVVGVNRGTIAWQYHLLLLLLNFYIQ